MNKRHLLDQLSHERQRWEQLVQSLSEEQLSQRVLPAGLAIKDVLAHLTAWMAFENAKLEACMFDREPQSLPWFAGLNDRKDQDTINARIFDSYKDQSAADMYNLWRDQYQKLIALGEEISEEEYQELKDNPSKMGEAIYDAIYGSYTHHHEEHLQPLTEWLTNQGWNK